jgi:hypothetical protein
MFWAFCTILLLQELWCKMARTGAIKPQVRAMKLRQNFCNKRIGSTPLDIKLMFLGTSDHFGTAPKLLQNWLNWCNFDAQVCAMKSRWNFSRQTHPIHPIGPQTHVLGRFGPFRYYMNFGVEWAEVLQLMHKFMPRSRVGIFSQ